MSMRLLITAHDTTERFKLSWSKHFIYIQLGMDCILIKPSQWGIYHHVLKIHREFLIGILVKALKRRIKIVFQF